MKIKDFGVEIWMNAYETKCDYNLAETCVESLTVKELVSIAGKEHSFADDLLSMKLTYGAIEGSDRLRDNIARLYLKQTKENVVITHGAIGANALIHETLVEPKDHVVSIVPTYQQHYSIPESYGAEVSILRLKEKDNFLPDLIELRTLARKGTKLIAFTNPNNPTGALIDEPVLQEIISIARDAGAWLLCDEVYRGINQEGNGFTASIADLYEKGLSTGSMSKAYSLAGLRLGWIVAPKKVIHDVSIHRDYNTISVGMLDDYFATMALDHKDKILARSRKIVKENLTFLEQWVAQEKRVSFVKPKGGTVGLLKIDTKLSSYDFCVKLLEGTGVMFTPGSAFDYEGYVRIGFANHLDVLKEGLKRVSEFLKICE